MAQLTEETGQELLRYLQTGLLQAQALNPLPPELGSIQTELSGQYMPGQYGGNPADLRSPGPSTPDPRTVKLFRTGSSRPEGPTRPAEAPPTPALGTKSLPPGVREALQQELTQFLTQSTSTPPTAPATRPAEPPSSRPFTMDVAGLQGALAAPSKAAAEERTRDQRAEDSMFASAGPQYQQGSKEGRPSLLEQEHRELAKFKEDTGGYLPPGAKVRHTAQGPVITMGKRDFESTMRWLRLKEAMGQSTILGQRARGFDPGLERQMRMADRREQDTIEREERKQRILSQKEQRQSENDVGILTAALTGTNASPELRALGNFISTTSPRAGGAALSGKGFDPGFLALARQGLATARGLAGGMEVQGGKSPIRLRLTEEQSRNISEYLNAQDDALAEAESVQATKQMAMDQFNAMQRDTAMGSLPNADVMGILQALPKPPAGDFPGTAQQEALTMLQDPVGSQYSKDVAAGVPSLAEGFGGFQMGGPASYRAPLKPETAGLVPRNVAAAIRLQNVVNGRTPVGQAVLALTWGLGNSAQRERLKQYVQSQLAIDDEDIAVRMTESDPRWRDIVAGSLDTYRRYRRAEGR